MNFTNSFTVDAPLDQVWPVLTNPQEVAPCVPGAQITDQVDERHFKGLVKIKLGAVQMSYRGDMEMEPDEAAHTIVLQGRGSDTRGGGGASGKVTVHLEPEGQKTAVRIDSEVDVTGRVATFGRSLLPDVANRLTREFATCLQQKLSSGPPSSEQASSSQSAGEQARQGRSSSMSAPGSAMGATAASATPGSTAPSPPPAGQQSPQPVQASGPATGTMTGTSLSPGSSSSSPSNNVDVVALLGDILRTRAAGLLRDLANLIEPR